MQQSPQAGARGKGNKGTGGKHKKKYKKIIPEINESIPTEYRDNLPTDEWIIPMNDINDYLKMSQDCADFRTKIYNDSRYIQWSDKYCSDNNIKPRKSKFAKNSVLGAGTYWMNWKVGTKDDKKSKDPEKHKYLCPSFHYIKQLYDAQKQKISKKNKK